jgi:DNA-binding SARP family transcriptional activator
MDELRIWLLGGFRVRVGEREVPDDRWRLRKACALVKLLALAPGRRMHREELIERLWPDLSPEAADNQLRKALHEARRSVDPDPAATFTHILSGPRLGLAPGTWVDLDAFEHAATEARRNRDPTAYERAIGMYGGDLLPEDRYEDWAEVRRETLRADFVALLVEWARLLEARAELDRAAAALRRVMTLDPAHEEAGAGLMRLHALAGRRQDALHEYERLRTALQEELDATPAAATQRLYEQIRLGEAPGCDLDADLWEQVGDLRLLSGDASGAAGAFEQAVRNQRPPRSAVRSARLHRKAAQAWLTDQRPGPAAPHLHAAQALTATVPGHELARRLAVEATWLWQTGSYAEAQQTAEAALRTAQASGAQDALALAHETLAIVLHLRGSWREGVQAEIDRVAAAPDADAGLATVSEVHCCIGQYHLYGDGLSDSVEDYARRTLELATARRAVRAEACAWCLLGEALLLQGRWDESGACLQRSAELHGRFGSASGGLSWQRLAELAVCRGDSATAQACLRQAMAIATVTPLAHHLWGRLYSIAALDAAERNDAPGVIRAARSAAAAGARYGDCPSCGVLLNPLAAAACAELGDRAGCALYAREAQRVADMFASSAWRAMAESAAGSLAEADGHPAEARARHLAAADLYDRARQPFWAARSRMQAALAHELDGRLDETGRRLIEEAATTFERLGALRALARARAAAAGTSPVGAGAPDPAGPLPPVENVPLPAGPRRGFADR